MLKYAKVIDRESGLCTVGLGTDREYYESIGMGLLDVEQSEVNFDWYLAEKCPHYTPEEKERIEQERINRLTMTPLDFLNFLKSTGLTDRDVDNYLATNINVKHQLQYCQNVYCGVAKSLMPIEYAGIVITAEMVEEAFKAKGTQQE